MARLFSPPRSWGDTKGSAPRVRGDFGLGTSGRTEPRRLNRLAQEQNRCGYHTQTTLDARPGGFTTSFPRPALSRKVIRCECMSRRKKSEKEGYSGTNFRDCHNLLVPSVERDHGQATYSHLFIKWNSVLPALLHPRFWFQSCRDGQARATAFTYLPNWECPKIPSQSIPSLIIRELSTYLQTIPPDPAHP